MFLLVLACGTILGDVREAVMLLGFVFVVLGITLTTNGTQRVRLKSCATCQARTLVIRGGERRRMAGREIVQDDRVVQAEGDRVPADSVVLSCSSLSTDKSLLTGESAPV